MDVEIGGLLLPSPTRRDDSLLDSLGAKEQHHERLGVLVKDMALGNQAVPQRKIDRKLIARRILVSRKKSNQWYGWADKQLLFPVYMSPLAFKSVQKTQRCTQSSSSFDKHHLVPEYLCDVFWILDLFGFANEQRPRD